MEGIWVLFVVIWLVKGMLCFNFIFGFFFVEVRQVDFFEYRFFLEFLCFQDMIVRMDVFFYLFFFLMDFLNLWNVVCECFLFIVRIVVFVRVFVFVDLDYVVFGYGWIGCIQCFVFFFVMWCCLVVFYVVFFEFFCLEFLLYFFCSVDQEYVCYYFW